VKRSSAIVKKRVKLIAWNIQHGGGTRLARIVGEITAHDPDVIAVTEFRARPRSGLVRRDEGDGIATRRDDAPGRKAEWNRGACVMPRL
jgi:hypothetical protein